MTDLHLILDLTRRHNLYVRDRIDLVASNSWVSDWARLTMASGLSNSYCIGFPGNRFYGGCSYIDMIEREVARLATDIYGAKLACVQFLSGMQANIGAYNAILAPGDTIVTAPGKHGGHYSHGADGPLRFWRPRILDVPFDPATYNIDLEGLEALFARERPKMIVCGWSEFLFAHPLEDVRRLCDQFGVRLVYDMSHVAGLIAGGVFQPEAGRLADVLTSSTGKSLHAPDHGLLLYNDVSLQKGVHDAVMPLLTSNTHPHELAALGVALSEMRAFGGDYARAVVANTKALGQALTDVGVRVLYRELGYSDSHTLLVEIPKAEAVMYLCDAAGISINTCALPWDRPGQVTGLRLGTQVLTRRGMGTSEMKIVAQGFERLLLRGEDPDRVRYNLVKPLAESFRRAAYSFDEGFPLGDDWQARPYATPRAAIEPEQYAYTLPALAELPVTAVRELARSMSPGSFAPGAALFARGEISDAVYFVVRGEIDIVDAGGVVVGSLGEGAHVGELGVMSGNPRSLGARAGQGGTQILRVEAATFRDLLARHPPAAKYFDHYVQGLDRQR